MPANPTEPTEPHDVRTIHQLVRMMKRYDLSAIDFIEGETKIRLRRRGHDFVPAQLQQGAMPSYAPASPQAPASAAPAAPAPLPPVSNDKVIESPMVGTFYSSPAPDAPPFVSVGSAVRADQPVCVIEAMKVFTDIPSGISGTITEVLVKSGQSVEFGQPMFRIKPS